MAINFVVNDTVRVVTSYVDITLRGANTLTTRSAVQLLGSLDDVALTVAAVGNIDNKSYIRLVPVDTSHPKYRSGAGVIVYFDTDAQLNNSLELDNSFYCDYLGKKVFNNTGSTLLKNSAVYYTGYNTTQRLPEVALASAAAPSTALFFGFLEEDIADQASGSCIVGGALVIDTGTMVVNDIVYLSDTLGAINPTSTQGTIAVVVGRVLTAGTTGSIQVAGQQVPTPSGGGGGMGVTGLQGGTGIKGCTGFQGDTGIQGDTGAQGETGIQGIQGTPGTPGTQGVTGFNGATGIKGCTGMQGNTGHQGDTGVQGPAGPIGSTGILGNTGAGIQGDTGVQGIQGDTGVQGIQGDTGVQGIQGDTGVQGDTGIEGQTGVSIVPSGTVSVLSTVDNLDLTVGATNFPVYSVPGGSSAVIMGIVMRITGANGITTEATVSAGWDPSTTDVFAPTFTTAVTALNDMWTLDSGAKSILGVAGATLLFGVTGMAGNTGFASVDIVGYEF